MPTGQEYRFLYGLWQASVRSNEQIWRALSNMPRPVMLNIMLKPTYLYEGERQVFLEMKKQIQGMDRNNEAISSHISWVEGIIKRRLLQWKKFFILQIHIMAEGELDENLLRSIGSSLTRDANELSLPGFQVNWPDSETTARSWCKNIFDLDFIPSSRLENIADSDEAFAAFRYPFLPEAGVPGANFISLTKEPPPTRTEQEE